MRSTDKGVTLRKKSDHRGGDCARAGQCCGRCDSVGSVHEACGLVRSGGEAKHLIQEARLPSMARSRPTAAASCTAETGSPFRTAPCSRVVNSTL